MADEPKCRLFLHLFFSILFMFNFIVKKLKTMLPSKKIQNGAQNQDGFQKVFIF
jgi:hypothetical protein